MEPTTNRYAFNNHCGYCSNGFYGVFCGTVEDEDGSCGHPVKPVPPIYPPVPVPPIVPPMPIPPICPPVNCGGSDSGCGCHNHCRPCGCGCRCRCHCCCKCRCHCCE